MRYKKENCLRRRHFVRKSNKSCEVQRTSQLLYFTFDIIRILFYHRFVGYLYFFRFWEPLQNLYKRGAKNIWRSIPGVYIFMFIGSFCAYVRGCVFYTV